MNYIIQNIFFIVIGHIISHKHFTYTQFFGFQPAFYSLPDKLTLPVKSTLFGKIQSVDLRGSLLYTGNCADSWTLGRVDHSLMNDQTLLEMLVAEMDGRSVFKDDHGDFRDISEWTGVKRNNIKRVGNINFENSIGRSLFDSGDDGVVADIPVGGSIDLAWLPDSLLEFCIYEFGLKGTIDTTNLPRYLKWLDICHNKFTGIFATECLPKVIQYLDISYNKLSGTLNFSADLPCLKSFFASDNLFTGNIDIICIPRTLKDLDVQRNNFSGRVFPNEIRKTVPNFHADEYLYN